MGKQKGKSKGAQTPQMDAQIAKVQTALGEDTVSVDVIKRVLAAHSNNARAAANAILDGEAFSGDFSFFFFFSFFRSSLSSRSRPLGALWAERTR